MKKHLLAFLIKFFGVFAILILILGFSFRLPIIDVLLLTVVISAMAYVIGDLYILARTNKAVGLAADFILVWAVIYLFSLWSTVIITPFLASLLATIGISLFELFFHTYVGYYVFPDKREKVKITANSSLNYQTEIAKEIDPEEEKT